MCSHPGIDHEFDRRCRRFCWRCETARVESRHRTVDRSRMADSSRYLVVTSRNVGSATQKQGDIGPQQTRRICQLEGAGRIVRFWMTIPIIGQPHVLKDGVLRIYWDGETTPSVETPLGDFFGATFGRPRPFVSARLVVAGGGYLCRFSMPFND